MYKMLACVTVLALTTPAGASVQIFYSTTGAGYGLTNPAMAFVPSEGNGRDISDGHYVVGAFPDFTPVAYSYAFETVYVWLRFNNEPDNVKINGLDLDASGGNPAAAAWYLLDDTLGEVANKRWDGASSPGAPEFQTPHKVMVAATAYGLKNMNADNPGWLYKGGTSRTYLLGALSFPVDWVSCTMQLGTAGISYSGGYPAPTVEFGTLIHIPEPAAAVMLALLGFSVRRR